MFDKLVQFREHGRQTPALAWSFLYFFLLLTAYYLLRPVREAMGSSANAMDVFPLAMVDWFAGHGIALGEYTLQALFTGTFVVMILLQPLYGALVGNLPRRRFLPVIYGVFILCLLGFYSLFEQKTDGRGALFFIWLAVFNLFAVSVFWSFMADIYSDTEARTLYGYIAAGGTIGGFLGPILAQILINVLGSIAPLMLVSAFLLGLCCLCIHMLGRWADRQRADSLKSAVIGGSMWAGLKLVWQTPLLRALAGFMIFGVGVGTLLYNEQAAIAKAFFPDEQDRTQFFSRIDLIINAVTLFIQVFLTRTLLRRFGVAPMLLIPAFAILLGYAALCAAPVPLLVAAVQIATRAGEFSLSKPARETLYTRVGRESRYKAKAFIDTAVYRGGDLTFSWVHKGLAAAGSTVVFAGGFLVAALMCLNAWRVIQIEKRMGREQA
ncbi:NTP/NDP exchange transporter [Arenimonas sp.]|jgi:AAA family ATP:ADP antiporter|uniref:NTP/NDP exchange transporter n=1 Tax=Arenimonas sp. TaxID=1872635 RepID=UPI0037BE5C87